MDLVIRAAVIFFFMFLVTLVQQGITQSDESVTGTLIVISTVALLSVSVGWLSFREGPPSAAHHPRRGPLGDPRGRRHDQHHPETVIPM
jgi:hypothetical protein